MYLNSTSIAFHKWNDGEKALLFQLVHQQTGKSRINWITIANKMADRTAKQCYDCYTLLNKQDNFNHQYQPWSADDEAALNKYILEHGVCWKTIQKELFPKRSISQLKNKYRQYLNRKLKDKVDTVKDNDKGTQELQQEVNQFLQQQK